jgi:uncharacterized protein YbjT (DUF2867 family)
VTSTVLVTGATGKTGRRLVPLLAARGAAVRAASRHPARLGGPAEQVAFDWFDETGYAAAVKGADAAYLVVPNPADPAVGRRADPAAMVAALLRAAADAAVRRVVLLSAFGVDRAPDDDPLRRVERAVEASGLPSTVLRPGAFMQNFSEPHWSGLDAQIRERDEFALPGGPARISYLSADDIAAVAAVALTEAGHEGRGYALTGPEGLTHAEVAAHLSAAAGRPIRYVEIGAEPIRRTVLAGGATPEHADYVATLFVTSLSSGALGVVTDDVRAVTGRAPTTFASFAAGAADAWRR